MGKMGNNRISLVQMEVGQKGRIIEINDGINLSRKLEILGIRVGEEIKKISEQLLKGPVFLQHNNTQMVVGFKMASKILVEVNKEDK